MINSQVHPDRTNQLTHIDLIKPGTFCPKPKCFLHLLSVKIVEAFELKCCTFDFLHRSFDQKNLVNQFPD